MGEGSKKSGTAGFLMLKIAIDFKTPSVQRSPAQAIIVGVSVGVVLWRLYFQSASYTPVVVVLWYLSICVDNIPYNGYSLGGKIFVDARIYSDSW